MQSKYNPMNFENYDTLMYAMRLVSRIGFVLLLFSIYRAYTTFSSPLLRLRNQKFVRIFTVVVLVGFSLLVLELFIRTPLMSIITMGFNAGVVFLLVGYMNRQVNMLEKSRATSEFAQYSLAMDRLISTLKHK